MYIVQYNCLFRACIESSLRSFDTSNPKRHRHVDADISSEDVSEVQQRNPSRLRASVNTTPLS
jgi:hypothetical protein